MISPSESVISLRTACSRSSNSPRYLAPATMAVRSRATRRLPGQAVGDVALDDALGQPLDYGRLAHPGLADEHRVVLGPPGQHPDHPPDLVVPADHRVEPVGPGLGGEVPAEPLQSLVPVLGIAGGDPLIAPDVAQGLLKPVGVEVEALGQPQQQVLGGQVVVAEGGPVAVGALQRLSQLPATSKRRSRRTGAAWPAPGGFGPESSPGRRQPCAAPAPRCSRAGPAERPAGDRE